MVEFFERLVVRGWFRDRLICDVQRSILNTAIAKVQNGYRS